MLPRTPFGVSHADRWTAVIYRSTCAAGLADARSPGSAPDVTLPVWSGTIGGGARAHVRRLAIRLQTAGITAPKTELAGKPVPFYADDYDTPTTKLIPAGGT